MTAGSMRTSRTTAVVVVTAAAFADVLAYSIAVPVLPDLSRRAGASPTTIGLLFGAFGVTLLAASVPLGGMSDRIGRRGPLVGGAIALAGATLLFALVDSLPWLFVARLVQGAADAVTWVVGFALIADLYGPEERGRVMGLVMSGTTVGFMIGPSLGGWLYEVGGARVPYLVVAGLAALCAAGFVCVVPAAHAEGGSPIRLRELLRIRDVAVCAATIVLGGGTLAMLEPTFSLFLSDSIGLGPARVGVVFGAGAVTSALAHPTFGRFADRLGARRLMFIGLIAMALLLPLLALASSFAAASLIYAAFTIAIATMVTPSLAYMADATSTAGIQSFGVAYGVYNCAWAVGLLIGPTLGGAAYQRVGFTALTLVWAAVLLPATVALARVRTGPGASPQV